MNLKTWFYALLSLFVVQLLILLGILLQSRRQTIVISEIHDLFTNSYQYEEKND